MIAPDSVPAGTRIAVTIRTVDEMSYRWTFPAHCADVQNAPDTLSLATRAAELMGIPMDRAQYYRLSFTSWEAKHRKEQGREPSHSKESTIVRFVRTIIRWVTGK